MVEIKKSAGIILYYFDEQENEPYFLLLKYPTYWGFAKGIIEKDETDEQTAIRETKEETGIINFKIMKGFEHKQKWFCRWEGRLVHREAIFFIAEVTKEESQKTRISEEHISFEWVTYKKAIEKMKVKNNQDMLKEAYDFVIAHNKQKKLF
jgi:8-oxo-dGTP pyrophosphatase MutT (NUDIX family)